MTDSEDVARPDLRLSVILSKLSATGRGCTQGSGIRSLTELDLTFRYKMIQ